MPIFAYFIFGLIAFTILVMVVINFMYHNVKKLREAAEDRYYRNQKRKEQKEKNPFGEDYFKSTGNKSQKATQYDFTKKANNANKNASGPNSSTTTAKEETTTRSTTTSGGVTIIDDRSEDKKIFTQGDGEYVEFEEVHD